MILVSSLLVRTNILTRFTKRNSCTTVTNACSLWSWKKNQYINFKKDLTQFYTHTQWHLLYVSLQTQKLSCGCHVFLYAFKIRSVFYHFSIWCIKQQHASFTFWSLVAWIHINKWGIIQHAVCMWSLVSQSPWVVAWAPTAQIRLVCLLYTNTHSLIYISHKLSSYLSHTHQYYLVQR